MDADRSDRTQADATEPAESASADTATPTSPTPDDPPPTSPAPAPAPTSLDDVVVIPTSDISIAFIPHNPDLIGPATDLADGRDSSTFLAEEMIFTGMVPPVIVDGAPLTRKVVEVTDPSFDATGATSASVVATNYRFALEIDSENVDVFGEAVLDELEPAIEAANPDETVSRNVSEGVLGQPIFELIVGPPVDPRMIVEVTQHYLIIPRLVDDPLLSVVVTRFADDPLPDELPTRDDFIDEMLADQLTLLDDLPGEPTLTYASVGATIPSAGAPVQRRIADFDYPIPTDGYNTFSDALETVVEAGGYRRRSGGGSPRVFFSDDEIERDEFRLSEPEPGTARVEIDTGLTPYEG